MRRQTTTRVFAVTFLLAVCGVRAEAATFIVPSDEELVEKASVIVTGTIREARVRETDDGRIETIYELAVDGVLKGSVGDVLTFREWGGTIDGRWMAISGGPSYEVGQRYLVFFDRFRDGRLTTLELALGRFRFVESEEGALLVRDLGDSRILGARGDRAREVSGFLRMVRDLAAKGGRAPAPRGVISPLANDLDTRGAAVKGASQWSSGTTVNYAVSSTPATGNTTGNDGEERILVDDPGNDISGSFAGSGTIAIAFFGGTTAGFTDRVNLTYSDIVVQDGVSTASGVSQEEYSTVLTHELGHTLGFRHSNQNKFSESGSTCSSPLPCSSNAIMNSFVLSGFNGILQSWDKAAVQTNYGSVPNDDYLIIDQSSLRPWYRTNSNVSWRIYQGTSGCTGPTITAGPVANPAVIQSGQTSQLMVSAIASQGSLQFQWYRGASGNTSNPVAGGTVNAISVSPGETTSYWVRITDSCGSVDSATVVVTVAVCEPIITKPPQNRIIGPGESTTLTVEAAYATAFTWYVGASGNTSVLVGTGPTLTVTPSQTTSYWVRVGNSCGTVDSPSVTVQVLQCPPPVISLQPTDVDIQPGEKATLQVVASGSGTLRFEWYLGVSGDTTSRVGEDQNVLVLENVTKDTNVWVRIYDECGFRDSHTARVRIVTICTQPKIVTQPADVIVPRGGRAILRVEATGSSLIYQWIRRAGTVALEVKGGTGPTLETDPIESDRIYFVQVRNNCGLVQSVEARVTVDDCSVPKIVSLTEGRMLDLGATIELNAVVDGTGPLEYQWYEGQSGSLAIPIQGATRPTLPVGPLSGSVSYWVRVSGPCGFADSDTIQLTVESSRARNTRRP